MHFKSILLTLLSLMILSLTSTTSAATYNAHLQIMDIGEVSPDPQNPKHPIDNPFPCGDDKIPEGGWACGWFKDGGVMALRARYQCDKGQLRSRGLCQEDWKGGSRCVRNQRRPHHRFNPFMAREIIVCQSQGDVDKD